MKKMLEKNNSDSSIFIYKQLREWNYGKLTHVVEKQYIEHRFNWFVNIALFAYYNFNSLEVREMAYNLVVDFLYNPILPNYYRLKILDLFYVFTNFTNLMLGNNGGFIRSLYGFMSSMGFDHYDRF